MRSPIYHSLEMLRDRRWAQGYRRGRGVATDMYTGAHDDDDNELGEVVELFELRPRATSPLS